MRKVKWEYFTGKMSEEELEQYGWEPFQFALKSDINTYLEADKDLIKLLEKKVYHEEVISVIESVLAELKQRTWQVKRFYFLGEIRCRTIIYYQFQLIH